jgi:hypothetical protein
VTYDPEWSRQSQDVVTAMWVAGSSAERRIITQAMAKVDRLLRHDPHEQGESRNHGRRVMFVPPLVIIFKPDDSRRVVRVLKVREMKPHN